MTAEERKTVGASYAERAAKHLERRPDPFGEQLLADLGIPFQGASRVLIEWLPGERPTVRVEYSLPESPTIVQRFRLVEVKDEA